MRTVLFTIRYGFVARNVLRTGLLTTLQASGVRVIVVCPATGEEYFVREAAERGVELVPFPRLRRSRRERLFAAAANTLLFDHPGVTHTMTVKWLRLVKDRRWLPWIAKAGAAALQLHRSRALRRLAERIDAGAFRHPEVQEVLARLRPDLVVTTDAFGGECHFLREARRLGIPSICLVKSWDNLTSKSRVRVEPDYYIVWNRVMKLEAERLHYVDPSRVFVSGAPNFDLFASGQFAVRPREQFMRSIEADPARKLVVYSPGNKLTYSDESNIRLIHGILESGEAGFAGHLYVRKYPKSRQDFSHLADLGHFGVGEAGIVVNAWADHVDQPAEHMQHLGEVMHHADVLVHLGSTVAVDAACFDTPIVGYFLDAKADGSRFDYAPHVFDLTHNRYLTDLGGQRVVRTRAELIEALRKYVQDPALDRSGRRRIVDAICGRFDGRSGERIAAFLVSVMTGRPQEGMAASLDRAFAEPLHHALG